ncbi:MAG: hypothetical protein LBU92_02080 [Prevotellaceae bacterium]|nr:hypothetical protein [Prevotellaceae bacterium]
MASFLKTGKPKGFNFAPRYYDERKENLEQRVERIKAEMGMGTAPAGASIRGAFQNARHAKPKNIFTTTGAMGKMIRLVSVLLIAAMLYFVFQAVGAITMFSKQQKAAAPTESIE